MSRSVLSFGLGENMGRGWQTKSLAKIVGLTMVFAAGSNELRATETLVAGVGTIVYGTTSDGLVSATYTVADGVVLYIPSTGRFEYAGADSSFLSGTVTVGNLDRETGSYSLSMTLDQSEVEGTYDMEATQVDPETAVANFSMTRRPLDNQQQARVQVQSAILIPFHRTGRVANRMDRKSDAFSNAEPKKQSMTNAAVSVPPHPGVLIVGGAVLVIAVVDDAVRGDSAYDCTSAWNYFWNGCWLE